MTAEFSGKNPEKEKTEAVADNARKFIVGPIDKSFLEENGASSTRLVVDWLPVDTDRQIDRKLAYKENLGNGKIEILVISKTGVGSDRKTTREEITQEEYERRKESLKPSSPHLEKTRYSFTYIQNDTHFPVKYDEFKGKKLLMLEVESPSEGKEEFRLNDFPVELREVSDDPSFSGSEVAGIAPDLSIDSF